MRDGVNSLAKKCGCRDSSSTSVCSYNNGISHLKLYKKDRNCFIRFLTDMHIEQHGFRFCRNDDTLWKYSMRNWNVTGLQSIDSLLVCLEFVFWSALHNDRKQLPSAPDAQWLDRSVWIHT